MEMPIKDYIKENYVSKNRIIAKMEELNNRIKTEEPFEAIFDMKQQQILQELLEEEE